MAETYDRQYRPVTISETGSEAGLSVAALHLMCDNINNAVNYALAPKILSYAFSPVISTGSGVTTEQVILAFAARWIPYSCGRIVFTVGHERFAGTGNTAIRLRLADAPYGGPATFDSARFGAYSAFGGFTITTSTHKVSTDVFYIHPLHRGKWCYPILTAQANTASIEFHLTTLDAACRLETNVSSI